MSDKIFAELEKLKDSDGPQAAADRLVAELTERREYHLLFDALLLQKRVELGLPLIQPTASDNVPDDKFAEFEKCYIDSARQVGTLLLNDGQIGAAWHYLKHIREPEPVRAALEKFDANRDPSEETDELINVALYEGAHPVKGLEIMLRVNGTCNTVTAMDQHVAQLQPADRRAAAAMLVRELYDDLCHTVGQEVRETLAGVEPPETLRELIADRDWLFENDNYHIDVSHLNAVVRFARFLEPDDPELDKAIQLTEYGRKLAPQFQYPADPPFDDFYEGHRHYFKVLADDDREAGLKFFREKIDEEPDEEDKPMIAYVLVDLLIRIEKFDEALELASQYLSDIEDPAGFSYSRLCEQAGRLDRLRDTAREKDDLVNFTAALLS